MKDIIIIGAGGHAAELNDYIRLHNNLKPLEAIKIIGFIDDDATIYAHYDYEAPYLGLIKEHQINTDVFYLMGIANLKYRKEITENFILKGAKFTGFIHPTVVISPSAIIDESVVISHSTSVGPKVKIGKHNLINSRCTIGHDTLIGEYNFISPMVALSGNTKIGNENLIGTGSITIPAINIGNNNKIGAGTVVIFDIPNEMTVVGSKPKMFENK
ncbi:MAG: acetyltransferase [Bacteroidia bacterium]|nr:acetyltransferase [Bacteroidia bacterium]